MLKKIIFTIFLFQTFSFLSYGAELVKIGLADNLETVDFNITSGNGVIVDDLYRNTLFFITPTVKYSIKKLNGNKWQLSWSGGKKILNAKYCSLSTLDSEDFVVFKNKKYRGRLIFVSNPYNKIVLINHLPVEEYLMGVVPKELYSSQIEAMKAQAIVARTYTMAHFGKHSKDGYDLCSTEHCQVYGGMEAETSLSNKAVMDTFGLVVFYNGKLASQILYHSTCGGCTEDNENVFFTPPVPYLRGVPCYIPFIKGRKNLYFCRMSPYFKWEVTWKKELLIKILEDYISIKYPLSKIGNIKGISVLNKGVSKRVCILVVKGSDSSIKIEGDEIRRALIYRNNNGKYAPLRSTFFKLTLKNGIYKVSGRGWGHGAGLCQKGAEGMAFFGADCSQIVNHYFNGVNIVTNYGFSDN